MKQKEKTIKEWLNTLKEPYKSKALSQTYEYILKEECPNLNRALYRMFNWIESKEGHAYWSDLVSSLENIEK